MLKQLRKTGRVAASGFGLLVASGLGAGCSNAPGTTYRLTPGQLAWQPYQLGQVLRFGNSRTPAIRTYRILNVEDVMLEGPHSNGLVVLPFLRRQDPDQFQNITVAAVRSDTVGVLFEALTLAADPSYSTGFPDVPVYGEAAWGSSSTVRLPIAEINNGIAFDTLGVYQHTRLLASLKLGSATYSQVVEVRRPTAAVGTTALYYAKGSGVVAFEERNTGLWYRLP